jgi:hypothetical protein
MGRPGDPPDLTPHKTFEEQELALINGIERAENRKIESEKNLSKGSESWSDYIPVTQEKKRIVQELLTHIYKVEEVVRLMGMPKGGSSVPVQIATVQPSVKSPKKKPTTVQRHKKQCRRVAKPLWEKYPTMTIADMILLDEISHACEGKVYTDKTLRNWIKDLCPDPSPGRRPKKVTASKVQPVNSRKKIR